jgi:hypothetical protein
MYTSHFCVCSAQDILPAALFIQGVHRCLLSADGAIFEASTAFDGAAVPAARQWLESQGQQVWAVAPLEDMPDLEHVLASNKKVSHPSEEDVKIHEFLNRMQATRGERSVLYVRHVSVCLQVLSADSQADLVRDRVLPQEPRKDVRLHI